jgi:hypothetical protein
MKLKSIPQCVNPDAVFPTKRKMKQPRNRLYYAQRFWAKVQIGKPDECWNWQAATCQHGYGRFAFGPRLDSAHRIAMCIVKGSVPEGLCVLHKCDNPACVNPDHLFFGTKKENTHDMVAKGRGNGGSMKGSRNPSSKLTEAQVLSIRARYKPRICSERMLAAEFGVSGQAIHQVLKRKKWNHV